jgi:hypothetical protein
MIVHADFEWNIQTASDQVKAFRINLELSLESRAVIRTNQYKFLEKIFSNLE